MENYQELIEMAKPLYEYIKDTNTVIEISQEGLSIGEEIADIPYYELEGNSEEEMM